MVWKNILTGLKVLVVLFLTNLVMSLFYLLIGLLFFFGILSMGSTLVVLIVTMVIIIFIMPVFLFVMGFWMKKLWGFGK